MSVAYSIMEQIQTALRACPWEPAAADKATKGIENESIVIRKPLRRPSGNELGRIDVPKPALVITCPRRVSNPSEGHNCSDDISNMVVVQLIATDHQTRIEGLQSFLNWEEEITRVINGLQFDYDETIADIWHGHAERNDNLQQTYWYRYHDFVGAIEAMIKSRETRKPQP